MTKPKLKITLEVPKCSDVQLKDIKEEISSFMESIEAFGFYKKGLIDITTYGEDKNSKPAQQIEYTLEYNLPPVF